MAKKNKKDAAVEEKVESGTGREKLDSKSQKIRELYLEGMSISDISRKLEVNYSFAYQVAKRCSDVLDDGDFSTNEPVKPTKADDIRKLWDEGLTVGDIAKQLNSNYSYVWSVCDTYRNIKDKEVTADK